MTIAEREKWYEYLQKKLEEHGIDHELSTLEISKDLSSGRDGDWEKYMIPNMILEVKRYGKHRLRVFGISMEGVSMPLGTIEFFDEEKDYQAAISMNLETKDLEYKSGDMKTCLMFSQRIVLLTKPLPDELLEDERLLIKRKAEIKPLFTENQLISCLMIVVFIAIIILLSLW